MCHRDGGGSDLDTSVRDNEMMRITMLLFMAVKLVLPKELVLVLTWRVNHRPHPPLLKITTAHLTNIIVMSLTIITKASIVIINAAAILVVLFISTRHYSQDPGP